ncbi:acyl-CoA dehydrogenase family member 11 [Oncorhynchus keta]|uniref:acyl-CoA dehydrogenase family member 11 n=1 Tax=Oncorhynchus keta TaxID=8018 RepID=UPI00227B23F3|nr:acyl-CoA dehydrogenase family member 11 [Oncorhynchus keta]
MAGIAQGVYVGHVLGNASAPNAAQFGQSVEPLGCRLQKGCGGPLESRVWPGHRLDSPAVPAFCSHTGYAGQQDRQETANTHLISRTNRVIVSQIVMWQFKIYWCI